jgi:acyl-homoserine lactone acylase PvdQ
MLSPLPRVTEETRASLVREIDEMGPGDFTLDAIAELQERNPELLQMAHNFASGLGDYLQAMQGFALIYRSLVIQSTAERARPH